ncbi:alkaline shock response membrane anchor protein AmaP [Streptococcus gallinaceus]|uniref:Flagellar basal body-associated protein FliL n=1 Tax=Streptococcus gallinaceus TaxID=165758 RepID=A0ABV2JJD1_9STRE|nr:alkaline shock response membrane anchor protein AmaP [Streptococcus gallinaceus]MCP1639018.1 flagellar basal body-associated protein FliL [Streptococcus gallinaceus]MCP1769738.1 flagellar basal body-associated protein FliL [Streptococcus gallinaceus]
MKKFKKIILSILGVVVTLLILGITFLHFQTYTASPSAQEASQSSQHTAAYDYFPTKKRPVRA